MTFDTNKVYTAINADELTPGSSVIVADDAYTLRTQVERAANIQELHCVYADNERHRFGVVVDNQTVQWAFAYLVKPPLGKVYRAYKNCNEMIEDYKKRFGIETNEIPNIWIKNKPDGNKRLIMLFRNLDVGVYGYSISMAELHASYTYTDGSPCSKLVTE